MVSKAKAYSGAEERVIVSFVCPGITAIKKDAGVWIETDFHAASGMSFPLLYRIEIAPGSTEGIRSETSNRNAERQMATNVVNELPAIVVHRGFRADAKHAGEKIINTNTTAPNTIVSLKQIAIKVVVLVAAEKIDGKFVLPELFGAFGIGLDAGGNGDQG